MIELYDRDLGDYDDKMSETVARDQGSFYLEGMLCLRISLEGWLILIDFRLRERTITDRSRYCYVAAM